MSQTVGTVLHMVGHEIDARSQTKNSKRILIAIGVLLALGLAACAWLLHLAWNSKSRTEDLIALLSATATWLAAAGTIGAFLYVNEQLQLIRSDQLKDKEKERRSQAEQLSAWFTRTGSTLVGQEANLKWNVVVLNASRAVMTNVVLVIIERGTQSGQTNGEHVLEPGQRFECEFDLNIDISRDPPWTKSYAIGSYDPRFVVLFRDSTGECWNKEVAGQLVESAPWGYHSEMKVALAGLARGSDGKVNA